MLTRGRVDAELRSGRWQSPWPGVLTDAGHVPDVTQRAWAAVLASGEGAYACGRTAARLHALPLVDDDDPATGAAEHRLDDVGTIRPAGTLRAGGRTLRRHQLVLRPGDLLTPSDGGPPRTSVLRTLVDLARLIPLGAVVCCIDDALHRRLVEPAELARAVGARKGSAGAPRLRDAVALADGRAEAPSETLLRLLLRPAYPALVPQVTLLDRAARPVARFDLADEAARVAVEADGKRGHSGELMVARDRRRDRAARASGWVTERVTWYDVRRRPHEVVARVGEAYAGRPGRRTG